MTTEEIKELAKKHGAQITPYVDYATAQDMVLFTSVEELVEFTDSLIEAYIESQKIVLY